MSASLSVVTFSASWVPVDVPPAKVTKGPCDLEQVSLHPRAQATYGDAIRGSQVCLSVA